MAHGVFPFAICQFIVIVICQIADFLVSFNAFVTGSLN